MRRVEDSWLWKLLEASPAEWVAFLAAVVGLVVAVWLAFRIRSWFRGGEDPAESEQQMLTQIGNLYRQGELTDEEYRSIKSRLVERLDGSLRRPDSKVVEHVDTAPRKPVDSPGEPGERSGETS